MTSKKNLNARFLQLTNDKNIAIQQLLKNQQKQLLDDLACFQPDIIITTARRYGKPSPILLNVAYLNTLEPGSIIEDLTASIGGNTSFTEYDDNIKTASGVFIHNCSNYPSEIPRQASQDYANCLLNLLHYLKLEKHQTIAHKLLADDLLSKAIIKK